MSKIVFVLLCLRKSKESERKRKRLRIEENEVIEESELNVAQLMLQLRIREQTVRDINKKKSKMLSFTASTDSYDGFEKRKSMKKLFHEDLDREPIFQWFNQQRASGTPMTGVSCANQAKCFIKSKDWWVNLGFLELVNAFKTAVQN